MNQPRRAGSARLTTCTVGPTAAMPTAFEPDCLRVYYASKLSTGLFPRITSPGTQVSSAIACGPHQGWLDHRKDMLLAQSELQAATIGEEEDAAAAADAQMQSVNRAFAAAKQAGVPAATRLMKELRRVCISGSYEVSVNEDAPQPLPCWAVRLYEFNFDEDSPLSEDLAELALRSGRDELRSVVNMRSWWCRSLLLQPSGVEGSRAGLLHALQRRSLNCAGPQRQQG